MRVQEAELLLAELEKRLITRGGAGCPADGQAGTQADGLGLWSPPQRRSIISHTDGDTGVRS